MHNIHPLEANQLGKLIEITERLAGPALIAAAAVCLLVSIALAIADRVAAGTLTAGLFVMLVLFCYLPQMESLKAFGIEAKWRERLREADEILRKLKQSATASAHLTYHTLGWGSRMGGLRWRQKQKLAEEVDAVLLDLGVESQQLSALKEDYLFFAAFDLYQLFEFVLERRLRKLEAETSAQLAQCDSNDERRQTALNEKLSAIRLLNKRADLLTELRSSDFRSLCQKKMPKSLLPGVDADKLQELADRLSSLVEQSHRTGSVPEQAIEILDGPIESTRKRIYFELFGEEP